jgi:nitrate reductase NapE component
MKNSRQIYQEISDNALYQSEVERAKAKFTIKPFVVEWYKVKQLAYILHPFLSVFSVVTGFGFLFYQFAGNLNLYLSAGLSLGLLIFLELLKSEVCKLSFHRFYLWGNSGVNFGLLLFALVFVGLSVFLSVFGAKELYKQLDKSESQLEASHKANRDSIALYYDTRIQAEKQSLSAFKSSVNWQGKINVSDKTVSTTIQSHTAKIDSLEADKRRNLASSLTIGGAKLSALKTDNQFSASFWFGLSLFVEGLIVLSVWFLVWYDWKVSKESELFGSHGQVIETDLNSLQSLTNFFLLNSQAMPLNTLPYAQHSGLINGSLNKQENQGILRDLQENAQSVNPTKAKKKAKSINRDYSGLITELKAGAKDFRTLTEKHKVNVNTLKKIVEQVKKGEL